MSVRRQNNKIASVYSNNINMEALLHRENFNGSLKAKV